MGSSDDIYNWMQCHMTPMVKFETWYNGYLQYAMDYYISDAQSIVLGYPYARQLRIKNSKLIDKNIELL